MSTVKLDPAAMRWLDRVGAGDRTRRAVEHFLQNPSTRAAFGKFAPISREMLTAYVAALVGGSVMMELLKQLHAGRKMDAEGLQILGRFLRDYPTMLSRFQADAKKLPLAEQREMMNTLLARAQAA